VTPDDTSALDALDEVEDRMRERQRDEEARERWTSARLRRARIAVLSAVAAALILGVLGVVLSIYAASRQGGATAAEVAPQVAAQVAQETIRDSRGSRLEAAKASLAAANATLATRGLGVVPEPDPSRYTAATLPDAYVIAASTAQTLAYLPDPIVGGLQVAPDGRLVVPSSVLVNPPSSPGTVDSTPPRPGTVTLVPGPGSTGTPGDRVLPRTLVPGGRVVPPASPPRGTGGGSSAPAPGTPRPPVRVSPPRLPLPLPRVPTDILPPPLPTLPSIPPLIGGLVA
jgi:hypothetical protein